MGVCGVQWLLKKPARCQVNAWNNPVRCRYFTVGNELDAQTTKNYWKYRWTYDSIWYIVRYGSILIHLNIIFDDEDILDIIDVTDTSISDKAFRYSEFIFSIELSGIYNCQVVTFSNSKTSSLVYIDHNSEAHTTCNDYSHIIAIHYCWNLACSNIWM